MAFSGLVSEHSNQKKATRVFVMSSWQSSVDIKNARLPTHTMPTTQVWRQIRCLWIHDLITMICISTWMLLRQQQLTILCVSVSLSLSAWIVFAVSVAQLNASVEFAVRQLAVYNHLLYFMHLGLMTLAMMDTDLSGSIVMNVFIVSKLSLHCSTRRLSVQMRYSLPL